MTLEPDIQDTFNSASQELAQIRGVLGRFDPALRAGLGFKPTMFSVIAQVLPLSGLTKMRDADAKLNQGGALIEPFEKLDKLIIQLRRENTGMFMAGASDRIAALLTDVMTALRDAQTALIIAQGGTPVIETVASPPIALAQPPSPQRRWWEFWK